MRRRRSISLSGAVMVIAALLAACGGGPATAPATSVAEPAASAPVTAPPSAGLTPVPGTVGGEPLGTVVARNIAFEPPVLTVAAREPFLLALRNEDPGIPHTLQVVDPSGEVIATSEAVVGPGLASLPVPALEPGSYTFVCTIHPNMTGTLTVE